MTMRRLHPSRLWHSAVFWSWGMNGVRLASGLLLLPLLLRLLPANDLGSYYMLLPLMAVVPMLDFGLAASIDRNVSYAMGGATQLLAQGMREDVPGDGNPNFSLLWKLLRATRVYYLILAGIVFLGLALVGTVVLRPAILQTSHPNLTWLAWGLAILNATVDLYTIWWTVYLRAMNRVLASARILFIGYALKIILAAALLLLGAGLASIFAAGLLSSLLIRVLSRRACLSLLPPDEGPPPTRAELVGTLRVLWPNGWRTGLQLFSGFACANANAYICFKVFGLRANSQYGLSLQVLGIIQGMAMVWTAVKWPIVGQYRARQDYAGLRRLLWPRLWLQMGTFLFLAALACALGPWLLRWIGSDKQLLPPLWFLLLLVHGFFDGGVTVWTTFLATENRVPSLWPIVAMNAANVVLVLLLIFTTDLQLGVFAVVPLITGAVFNYWYWPIAGARNLRTTWLRFTFSRAT